MKKNQFDFGGWATKNDLLCADGRTIRKDAFKDDDGRTVPLVYQHNHEDPTRVIGHALLENRDEGVYAYCSVNNSPIGQHVKECVRHGDINALSIYANKLTQRGGDVLHGVIRELSVVLAGANPGAVIEFPLLAHGEESDTEAFIWTDSDSLDLGPGLELTHADKEEPKEEPKPEPAKDEEKKEEPEAKEETVEDVLKTLSPKQRKVVDFLMTMVLSEGDADDDDSDEEDEEVKHADEEEDDAEDEEDADDDETVQDVLNTLTKKQREVVEALLGAAAEEADKAKKNKVSHADIDDEEDTDDTDDDDDTDDEDPEDYEAEDDDEDEASHADEEGEEFIMKKNVFDNSAMAEQHEDTLSHAQMDMLLKDGKRLGSLRASVLEHAAEYGIEQIDWLFPDARNYTTQPGFVQRDQGWVSKVMQGTSHTLFSRIKTLFADITEDEARARGYIKGKQKKNEVFTLLKRTTDPQTIYKKQKLDRDDVIDITDFDVVAWMKQEMRAMLNEEIARAILIGDGREGDSDDHISEDHIRSVLRDDELFVVRKLLTEVEGESKSKTLIKCVRKGWVDYRGSGNCIAFMTEEALSDLLLLEDGLGHFMYPTKEVAANVLGVREIVTVPPMADASTVRVDTKANKTYKPLAIILNLSDYNVGADKGGSVNMFEDFDIDYNAQKYLIETRCSGALVRPYSAIVIEEEVDPTQVSP